MRLFLSLILSFVFFTSLLMPAKAEFLFDPLFVIIEAKDGSGSASLKVSNPFEKPARIQISFDEWELTDDNSFKVVKRADNDEKAVIQYIKASPKQFTIMPGEEKVIRIACKLPSNFEDKEYNLFLNLLEIGAERKSANSGSEANKKSFGLIINKEFKAGTYIRKGSPEALKTNFQVKDLKFEKREKRVITDPKDPKRRIETDEQEVQYKIIYTNTGKAHIRKDLGLRIFNEAGALINEVPFVGTLVAFPSNGRAITAEKSFPVPNDLKDKNFSFQLIIVDGLEDKTGENNPPIKTDTVKTSVPSKK